MELPSITSTALNGAGSVVTSNLGTTSVTVGSVGSTVYSYTATGAVGSTATVLGSNDGTNWVTIGTLTCATDTVSGQVIDAFSAIHAFRYIKKVGVAVVSVSRG